jgi:pimeloyl-ACP methyl ester carboxylesterase
MKTRRFILKLSVISLSLITFVSSCKKDETRPDYTYLVSNELAVSFNTDYVNGLLDVVSESIPDVSSLKSSVTSDIDIYKIVYKTNVNGNNINASGLVCVPVTPGDYPVLSFQNGTNTVNAYSPSEFPISYSYQMIEIIASMGYIVVIADYPGFGESVNVPHPYLVTEPTVRSLVDMLYSVKEFAGFELPGITLINEYYLLGYSQGGWATLALHKALELDYPDDFNLKGSVCGAGPYNIYLLLQEMVNADTYPMPVYLGYILNAYKSYNQFTNPVSDIFNEPYATRVSTLYNGSLSFDEINSQLTTSINELINPDFLTGFSSSPDYGSVRDGLNNNSITAWHTQKPLLLIHGGADTQVNPVSTENMYDAMIQAGTSPELCEKVILPDLDHSDGVAPCMVQGILFLRALIDSD